MTEEELAAEREYMDAVTSPDNWCFEHMVEKLDCVHCQFGDDTLIFMHTCPRCSVPHDAKTWGWRAPDGQELCIRCMAIGAYQDIVSHALLMPQFPNNAPPRAVIYDAAAEGDPIAVIREQG